MRIAYLITAYRELSHLRRLHDVLMEQDPGSIAYVQFDLGSPWVAPARELPFRINLTSFPIRWGDGTYVRALIESLRDLSSQDWDWVAILSGQDYPVRPLGLLRQELETSIHRAYAPVVGRSHGLEPAPAQLIGRYMYRYRWLGTEAPLLVRAAARELDRPLQRASRGRFRLQPRPREGAPGFGVRRQGTFFSDQRPCWMGPDYVVMERSMVRRLLDLLDREPEILRYYDETFVPSESLFTSVLRWIDAAAVADRNFHFMRFGGHANPRRIDPEDLPELWDLGPIFARKFDDRSDWVTTQLPMRTRPA